MYALTDEVKHYYTNVRARQPVDAITVEQTYLGITITNGIATTCELSDHLVRAKLTMNRSPNN